MKFAIPEISWHNRDPVLSVDFQPRVAENEPLRLASGGSDSHVLIWYMKITENGFVNLEIAADLNRHQKSVNVVRWSPNGHYLASGDDESIIFVWKQKNEEPAQVMEGEEQFIETWVIYKTLRGHMEDVLDISWSSNSLYLASGSIDNKLIMWELAKGKHSCILSDHKGFVQGVCWDPKGQMIATTSTDRVFRTFDVVTKKVTSRSSKAKLPFPKDHPLCGAEVRLYHDDTLQTYYRRLQFSPDGLLLAVPAGLVEPEQGIADLQPINAVYIYTRYSLKVPSCVLPCGEPALATRWSPLRYALRPGGPAAAFPLNDRMVLAVATKRSVIVYDTQQKAPIALISNMHYTKLTDLTWSPDGRILVASSTDGYCSIITFSEGELGEILPEEPEIPENRPEPMDISDEPQESMQQVQLKEEPKSATVTLESFFKIPSENTQKKSTKNEAQPKTPVKMDVLEDSAMFTWPNKTSIDAVKPKEVPEVMFIEDSEDIKLVYDESQSKSNSPEFKNIQNSEDKGNNLKSPAVLTEKVVKMDSVAQNLQSSSKSEVIPIKKQRSGEDMERDNDENKVVNSSKDVPKPSSFMKQAKVTDVTLPPKSAVASPKAPRRVSFITLSSPKNKKKS